MDTCPHILSLWISLAQAIPRTARTRGMLKKDSHGYTPELNPVEVQWDIIKKAAANTLYAGTEAMKSVRRMLRTKEIGVAEMSHYLPG